MHRCTEKITEKTASPGATAQKTTNEPINTTKKQKIPMLLAWSGNAEPVAQTRRAVLGTALLHGCAAVQIREDVPEPHPCHADPISF
jgi:hypothetical protein